MVAKVNRRMTSFISYDARLNEYPIRFSAIFENMSRLVRTYSI